jgi:hypothetical protein
MKSLPKLDRPDLRAPGRAPFPLALPFVLGGLLITALLWLLAAPTIAQAQDSPFFATDILAPTGIVDNRANFTSTGPATPFGLFGFAVAPAGDVNGDGFADVLVGADTLNAAYLYLGSSSGLSDPAYFTATGNLNRFGYSVGGGGDVNGDTFDDFIVGAPAGEVISGPLDSGNAVLYYGAGIGLPTAGITLSGEASDDNFGWSVAVVGDLNGDTYADVAVGAVQNDANGGDAGRVYLYYGTPTGIAPTPSYTLTGESALDGFGVSVAGVGDLNGDGIDDLAVGAWRNNAGGNEAGKAYLYYGSPTGIDGANFSAVIGQANNKLGTSVHGAGDVNGDGYADLMVGGDSFNVITPAIGIASVFAGGPSGLITTPIFSAVGEGLNDRFGFAVGGQGDVNGDGFDDIFIGAYGFDSSVPVTLTDVGKVYGYGGCLGGIAPGLIFSATGEIENESYGRSLSVVGDVNGDGIDDLVVGAFGGLGFPFGPPGLPTGRIYAYYGQDVGGCRSAIRMSKMVALADYPALLPYSGALTVPVGTTLAYRYVVTNTGNLTLTHQRLVDGALGVPLPSAAVTLTPGMSYTVILTAVPGVSGEVDGIRVASGAGWRPTHATHARDQRKRPGHRHRQPLWRVARPRWRYDCGQCGRQPR